MSTSSKQPDTDVKKNNISAAQTESLAFSVCRRSQLQALPDCVL